MAAPYPQLSTRLLELKEAETLIMARKAREMRASGREIINLSIGEPDFDTPAHIKQAATRALEEGNTSYPPLSGHPILLEAIRQKFQRENNLRYETSQIVVANGAKQSLIHCCLALLNPGDEVLLPAPCWVSYVSMASMCQAHPVMIHAGVAQDFKITPQQLRAAITERSKLLILNSPNNPTGCVYSRGELQALADVLQDFPQITVLSDEIYEHISYDIAPVSFAALNGMYERTVTINGFSKGFAMTGWRLGYIGAPQNVATACAKLQGVFSSGPVTFNQIGAAAALDGSLDETHEMVASYKSRREIILNHLKKIEGVRVSAPQGAFYAFPDMSAFFNKSAHGFDVTNSLSLADYLLERAGVSVVPGVAFGDDNCIRLSFAASAEDLQLGLEKIAQALGDLG